MAVKGTASGGNKMNCSDIKKLFSGYIDGDLDEQENSLVLEHLKICNACSKELKLLEETVSLLKIRKPVEPPADFVAQVRNKIEARRWWKEAIKVIFYPLHIKIPAEAIATVVIVCVLYYVYQQPSPVKPGRELIEKVPPAVEQPILQEKKEARPLEIEGITEKLKSPAELTGGIEEKKYESPVVEREEKTAPVIETREDRGISYDRDRVKPSPAEIEYTQKSQAPSLARSMPAEGSGYPTAGGHKKPEGTLDFYDKAAPITSEGSIYEPETEELSITLKKPKKDLIKIKKYLFILNAKDIIESTDEEIKESVISFQIKKKDYLMLTKKLIEMDVIKPQDIKETREEDITVRLKIR